MVKFGGDFLMVWGCMGSIGVQIHVEIKRSIDTEQSILILGHNVLPRIQNLEILDKSVIIQQYNDPRHSSRTAQYWPNSQWIKVLDWPVQFPDLNPIHISGKFPKKSLTAI